MLRNYFITAFRNLYRNKANTTINVLGLTLGITCSLVLFMVIRFELSFNTHHPDADRIYRIISEVQTDEGIIHTASMQFPIATAFSTAYPDVPVTLVHNNIPSRSFYVEKDGERTRFQESSDHMALVHQDYLEIFQPEWLAGNREEALVNINSIVLTRKMAEKFFGTIDVVGKTLGYASQEDLLVTGVIEDYPQTTDFPIDILISIETNGQYRDNQTDGWGGNYSKVNAFIKLPEGMDQAAMEARLEGFDETYSGRELKRQLQPLSDLHYNGELGNYSDRTMSTANLLAIGLIGLLLLVAACINFVNLNTALAVRRSKEVGIRKVLGGSRKQLLLQFMGETLLVTLIALVISFGATELAIQQLKTNLDYDLQFRLFQDAEAAVFLVTVFACSALLSGLYPALVLASFKPIGALRNRMDGPKRGFSLRKVLVTTQLVISQALILCTLVVIQQMDYFYNAPLGLNPESVLELSLPGGDRAGHAVFKNRALAIPGIEAVTLSNSGAISSSSWVGPYELTLKGEQITRSNTPVKFIDKDFLDTYGVNLLAGENIRETDSVYQFLVNEKLIEELGITDPYEIIGEPMEFWGRKGFITGVVSNYNTQSLHSSMEPVVMVYGSGYSWAALRFNTTETREMVTALGDLYADVFPERDFNPSFLDEIIANFYVEEQKASTLFQVAAGVAIFIGCIGMIGLISYMANRKTKEVGIRKVLGASVANILMLFSRHFLFLTLTGFVIAAPLAYYLMTNWLQNFEYRISFGAETFAFSLLASILLVVVATGLRAYRSATVNPVRSLRSE